MKKECDANGMCHQKPDWPHKQVCHGDHCHEEPDYPKKPTMLAMPDMVVICEESHNQPEQCWMEWDKPMVQVCEDWGCYERKDYPTEEVCYSWGC